MVKILFVVCNLGHVRSEHAEAHELAAEEEAAAQAVGGGVGEDAEVAVDAAECPYCRHAVATARVQRMCDPGVCLRRLRVQQQVQALAYALQRMVRHVGSPGFDVGSQELHAPMHLRHLQFAHVQLQTELCLQKLADLRHYRQQPLPV